MASKDLDHPFSTEAGWVIAYKPSPILAACGAWPLPKPPNNQLLALILAEPAMKNPDKGTLTQQALQTQAAPLKHTS